MQITKMINDSVGLFSAMKALSVFVVVGLLAIFALSFEARAADDGVPFNQELANLAQSVNPPFSDKFVAAFLADSRFSQYATTPPADGTSKETFAKMAFGNYLNEQLSQAPTKTVSAADFLDKLEGHIDSNFSTAPEMALKAGLEAYLKEKYPNGLPDPMTFKQIDNFLSDFSSWMKFTPYGKLGGKLDDKSGVILPESFKANVYNGLLEDVRAKIRNGDYLPVTGTMTPPTTSSPSKKSAPPTMLEKSKPADNFIIDEDPTGAQDRNSLRDQGTQSAPSTAPSPSAPTTPDDF